jgi:hypothetical protein
LATSNFHNPEDVAEGTRGEKDETQTRVSHPKALAEYNKHMNCIDIFDQLKGAYSN